jgi:hypothetical protein
MNLKWNKGMTLTENGRSNDQTYWWAWRVAREKGLEYRHGKTIEEWEPDVPASVMEIDVNDVFRWDEVSELL